MNHLPRSLSRLLQSLKACGRNLRPQATANHAVRAYSVVEDELQELLGLRNRGALFHLYCPEIELAEGVKIDEVLEQRLDLHAVKIDLLVRCEEPCLVGNSLFGGLRSALFPGFFVRMCFIVFRLEGLECRESISDNFLMICFHLLSQVLSRYCLKSPVCHHGLSFTSCHVSVIKML